MATPGEGSVQCFLHRWIMAFNVIPWGLNTIKMAL